MNRSAFYVPGSVLVCLFAFGFAVQAFGIQGSAEPRFDAVSIKPSPDRQRIELEPTPADGYRRVSQSVASLVQTAYDIAQPSRVSGLPEWTRVTMFDIVARAGHTLTKAEREAMLRTLLVERFRLRAHMEPREQTVYVMTTARPDGRLGPGLTRRPECEVSACASGGTSYADRIQFFAVTLRAFADGMLSNVRREIVRDETGIPGAFDITMSWRPDSATADPDDVRPSFFTAMQEQLGLKLEPQKRTVDVLVVEAIERPTPD